MPGSSNSAIERRHGPRVLVIKLGALGDFVLAMGPAAAIRRHHANAQIVLLTTRPFVELGRAAPYFDVVVEDVRPKPWQLGAIRHLAVTLGSGFDQVYDLQTSDRSSWYFRLARAPGGGRPEWSGIAPGCSHPHRDPNRDQVHTIERQADQLADAGILEVPFPDLSWAPDVGGRFGLSGRYALVVPGGAPHRPDKRWPAERFGAVAEALAATGVTPVVVGTQAERDATDIVLRACPDAIDLVGRTRLVDLPGLSRRASFAVGNDTGPMHVAAIVGVPSIVLFSRASDPAITAPRAPPGAAPVTVLQRDDLRDLPVDAVVASLKPC